MVGPLLGATNTAIGDGTVALDAVSHDWDSVGTYPIGLMLAP